MDVTDDSVVVQIEYAVRATLRGDTEEARHALASIPRPMTLNETRPPAPPWKEPTDPPRMKTPRIEAPIGTMVEVFHDDQFTCRLCGKRTILVQVLRLLSGLYPDLLPDHPNWKWEIGHPIYWTHTTSIEHLVPLSRGGSPGRENLVTACYICNDTKSYRFLSELGWQLRPPSAIPWDGLTGLYPQLCEVAGKSRVEAHRRWLRVLALTASPRRTGTPASSHQQPIPHTNVVYRANPTVTNAELNQLFAASWPDHAWRDFTSELKHCPAIVCAYAGDRLVGFVKLAWDGGGHAFLLDTTVHPDMRRQGIGRHLVQHAIDVARDNGMRWVHVDFDEHLREFYRGCGFRHTEAGLIELP